MQPVIQKIKPLLLPKSEAAAFRGLHLFTMSPLGRGPFSAFRLRIDPDSHFPAIYHEKTYEFFLVLKGEGYGRVARRQVRFKTGDHVYLPPRTIHDFHTGRSAMEALVIFSPCFDIKNPDVVKVRPHAPHPGAACLLQPKRS